MEEPPAERKDAPKAVGHPDGKDISGLKEILKKVLRSFSTIEPDRPAMGQAPL